MLVFFLSGFAAVGVANAESFYDVEKTAKHSTDPVEKKLFQDLADIHSQLAKVSNLKLRFLLSDSDEVNAYATESKGERLVVLHWGLLEALADDRDAVAAVLAHEYAHHGKDHMEKTKSSNAVWGVLGAIAGAAIDISLGTRNVGSQLGDVGAKVVTRAFSRDQEREADSLGMQWMIAAGYNPMGAVRMQRKLMELAGSDDKFSLFRTHPPSKERGEELDALIAKSESAKPLVALPKVALTLPEDEYEEDDEATADAAEGAAAAMKEPVGSAKSAPAAANK